MESVGARTGFMSAASPGVVSLFFRNDHYKDFETYIYAIAEAMRHEYEAVAKGGLVLQLDCPDLGMGRHIQYADLSIPEFRKRAQLHVEALNHAVANIPAEQLRIHLCWGNYEGPHHCDVPLADVIDIAFMAKVSAISLEAANPRHAHEWTLFEKVRLPEGKVLIPGVIELKSNFIEHPELIAQRIARYANLVGRENVIAGSDCGYGTWVGQAAVDPDVVWAKFAAMAEGARIATSSSGSRRTAPPGSWPAIRAGQPHARARSADARLRGRSSSGGSGPWSAMPDAKPGVRRRWSQRAQGWTPIRPPASRRGGAG